jgi:membrane metallo-endopeptidase-like protein 1
MCWHVLQHLIHYLPSKMLNRAYQYIGNVNEKEMNITRWKTCVDDVENRFSAVISTAYIKKYLDDDTRRRAISMIRNIKYQFKKSLYKLDWLDGKTKDIASEILLSSVEDIPRPDNFVQDETFYNKKYWKISS